MVNETTPESGATQPGAETPPPAASGGGETTQQGKSQESGAQQGASQEGKSAKVAFFNLRRSEKAARDERDVLTRENEELKRLLQDRETRAARPAASGTSNLLDDPDGWAAAKEKEISERVISAIEERARESRLMQDSSAAESWLLNRPHLKDPAFAEDVKRIIESDPEVRSTASVAPKMAAKLAYIAACEARGIAPALDNVRDAGSAAAAAARSSGVAPRASERPGGEKRWGRGEVSAYLSAVPMGSPEFKQRLAEVKKAQEDGRAP